MTLFSKLKGACCACLLWLVVLSCNQVTDLQPNTPDPVPAQAIDVVTDQFPQAEDMVFTTLEKNRLWRATFRQKASRYDAVANPQMLLVAYQVDNSPVPDSLIALVRNSMIDGGEFSNLRIQKYYWSGNLAVEQTLLADYQWQGRRYTLRWFRMSQSGTVTYTLELAPYWQQEYNTSSLADLPDAIQQSLNEQRVDFRYAVVRFDEQTKRQYKITVSQGSNWFDLTYTDDYTLIAAYSQFSNNQLSDLSKLPLPAQTYLLQTPELADIIAGGLVNLTTYQKTTYAGLETYSVMLTKNRQNWLMTFSSTGQLITRSYVRQLL